MSKDPPPARIRPFEPKDIDAVRYFVGSSIMEGIPYANRAIFRTSGGFAFFLLLAVVLTYVTGLWPSLPFHDFHTWSFRLSVDAKFLTGLARGLLLLVPYLGAGLIVLGLAEIQHRSIFERGLERRLGQDDMRDISGYYGNSCASSGFYVLDYDGKVIGCAGLDASRPKDALTSLTWSTDNGNHKLRQRKKGVAATGQAAQSDRIALLRVLTVSAAYRRTGIEEDLLRFALQRAFNGAAPFDRVEISLRPHMQPEKLALLQKHGFQWSREAKAVDEDLLEVPKDAKVAIGIASKSLASVWPIDFKTSVWALKRSAWRL